MAKAKKARKARKIAGMGKGKTVTGRVLHDPVRDKLRPIFPLDLSKCTSIDALVRAMGDTAYTGRQIGDVLSREGSYRLAFPEDMTDLTIRLNGHWDESEMDEWSSELPTAALDALHSDLRAAQKEHRSTHHDHAASAAEHSAAS